MPVERSNEWKVRALRGSVFTPRPTTDYDLPSWEQVVGTPPETISNQPRLGTKEETGEFQDGRLVCEVQIDRIHWRYSSSVEFDAETLESELGPGARPFPNALEWFNPMMREWVEKPPELARVAFGARLVLPVQSREEGYQVLDTFLPAVEVDPASRDFRYSINRRRASRVLQSEIEINRLSHWNVGALAARIQQQNGSRNVKGPELFIVQVELDINSAPEVTEVPSGKSASSLFNELIELATEIAQEGDIR